MLGFGVVGGGIACVLDENRERIEALAGGPVNLKYILDFFVYNSRILLTATASFTI